jgi:hypothetical protein
LLEIDGYGWTDIATMLAEDLGLIDETGRPVSPKVASGLVACAPSQNEAGFDVRARQVSE